METLYTLKEVADMTGFALRTLQRDARAGKFVHIHRGRSRCMTMTQIEQLIHDSTVQNPAPPNNGLDAVRNAMLRERR